MLSVGAAALLTCYLRNIKISTLGWNWGEWKYQKMSFFIPLAFIAVSYAVIWLSGIGEWYNTTYLIELKDKYNLAEWNNISILVFHFFITATITFLLTLPSALGEELAWRGFLVSELAKFMTFTNVALASGFLWALFHYPLIFMGLYGNNETPITYQLFTFTVYIMGLTMIMTYLRYKTNSLWTAVIFHASGNVFMQKFFTPLSIENSHSSWFVDEFGAVPAIVVSIFAIYFWNKGRREFPKSAKD
jgi:membrane protease YdiL (CAAX protease family)